MGELFLLKVDPIIRFLTVADIVWYGAAGMLGPVFAIFIVGHIIGAGPEVVGIAEAVLLISQSIVQVPAAALMDRIKGERDDFLFLFIFGMIASIVPLSYLFISTPFELYIAQFVLGAAIGASYPASMALLTRHIKPEREATTWSVYYMLINVFSGATAAIGGVLAATVGFETMIMGVVAVGVLGTLLYIPAGLYINRVHTLHKNAAENKSKG